MKNVNPYVSVVVPIYNVEKYLKRALETIINQTLKNIEIILIDDGATDSSPQICDEYGKIDSRIKIIHKRNAHRKLDSPISIVQLSVGIPTIEKIFFVFCDRI